MIDIHSHILPGVDDGSSCLEESLEMAEIAAENGTRYLTATPHCNIPGLYQNYRSKYLLETYEMLKQEIIRAGIPLKLLLGMEIFAVDNLPGLFREKKVWTLNGSGYFLTEMAFDADPEHFEALLDQVVMMGYHPIIAHPERYYSVQDDPRIALSWYRKGFGLQINKGSLLGRFGREEETCAHELVSHHICTCIASDAHSSEYRTPALAETEEMLEEIYGERAARLYLRENPRRILSNQELIFPRPAEI